MHKFREFPETHGQVLRHSKSHFSAAPHEEFSELSPSHMNRRFTPQTNHASHSSKIENDVRRESLIANARTDKTDDANARNCLIKSSRAGSRVKPPAPPPANAFGSIRVGSCSSSDSQRSSPRGALQVDPKSKVRSKVNCESASSQRLQRDFSGQSVHEIFHQDTHSRGSLLPPSPRSLKKQGHESTAHFVMGGSNPRESWIEQNMTHKRHLKAVLARERLKCVASNLSGPGAHIQGGVDDHGQSVAVQIQGREHMLDAVSESVDGTFRMDSAEIIPHNHHPFELRCGGRSSRSRPSHPDHLQTGSLVVLSTVDDRPQPAPRSNVAWMRRKGNEIHGVPGFGFEHNRGQNDGQFITTDMMRQSDVVGPAGLHRPPSRNGKNGSRSSSVGRAPIVVSRVSGSPAISGEQQALSSTFFDRRH